VGVAFTRQAGHTCAPCKSSGLAVAWKPITRFYSAIIEVHWCSGMLVRKKMLIQSLANFALRNKIIERSSQVKENEKNYLYHWILAFLLGSNVIRDSILDAEHPLLTLRSKNTIHAVYFCLLLLDKQISIASDVTVSSAQLTQLRENILVFYNKSYLQLLSNPTQFILTIRSMLDTLGLHLKMNRSERAVLQLVRAGCQEEFARLNEAKLIDQPTKKVRAVANDVNGIGILFNPQLRMNRFITASSNYSFFYSELGFYSDYPGQKILLQEKPGPIIDGLYVRNIRPDRLMDVVVLVLLGHFQAEGGYIAKSAEYFPRLFSSDTVFINHRNYSPRSNQYASSAAELARDVTTFARYFRAQGKQVVLYGMCGGAPHMILAANQLTQEKIPYKIILDRFVSRYSKVGNIKSIVRKAFLQREGVKREERTLVRDIKGMVIFFLVLLLVLAKNVAFVLTRTDIDFVQRVLAIPAQDRLILQAKSKKDSVSKVAMATDMFVHPQDDLRQVVKSERQRQKNVLKNLMGYCQHILLVGGVVLSASNLKIFFDLRQCFELALALINDEKLTFKILPKVPTDLHSEHLFDLATRSGASVGSLLTGFFKSPLQRCDSYITELADYSRRNMLSIVNQLPVFDVQRMPDKIKLASGIVFFLRELKENERFVINIFNRITASDRGQVHRVLAELLASPIFTLLKSPALDRDTVYEYKMRG
jgi:hypothetical protein